MSSLSAVDQTLVQMQINISPVGIGPTMGQMSSSRPKTSHTIIERRCRTDFNARIQSPRMAAPALKERKSSEPSKVASWSKACPVQREPCLLEKTGLVDLIDERGYVDGVKVARKCSKANVLGKAVEYIKVLKRREQRLRAEQTGKALVAGLVGGPALLREWEREWKERCGGEERDELDADELANNEAEAEDSDEEDEDEDESGCQRQEDATIDWTASIQLAGMPPLLTHQPRGSVYSLGKSLLLFRLSRRRRICHRNLPADQDVNMMVPTQQQSYQSQPQQYLLATFALFSFFNSPLTQTYSSPSHHHHQRPGVVLNHPPLAYAPEIVHGLAGAAEHHQAASQVSSWGFTATSTHKLGVKLCSRRLGDVVVVYLLPSWPCCFCDLSASKSSPSLEDLCTFSLVLHGTGSSIVNALLRGRSRVMWGRAKVLCASLLRKPGKHVHMYERLVMDNIDVDEAATRLASNVIIPQLGLDMDQEPSPFKVLGAIAARDRMKKHLAAAFVKTAVADDMIVSDVNGNDDNDDEDERQQTFSAASELGGSLAQLGKIAERLCRLVADGTDGHWPVDAIESAAESWRALRYTDPVFLLKKTLGSGVFDEECVQGLEDARNGAVDLIVKIERKRTSSDVQTPSQKENSDGLLAPHSLQGTTHMQWTVILALLKTLATFSG
ncbi:hypothetical protein JOM56_012273 [Amanita muscaria]